MISTLRYIRKPLYVDAVRVTAANFEEIAAWCQGEMLRDEPDERNKKGKRYIRVRVHNPVTPKQSKAYVGDWILYTEKGYKIYNNRAFLSAFDPAPVPPPIVDEVPLSDERLTGDPVVDATADESVQAGADRLRAEQQPIKPHVIEEAELHSVGPVVADPSVDNGVGEIEIVPATPEAVADAILEDDVKRADLDIPPKQPFSQGGGGPVALADDVKTVDAAPEQESIEPAAAEGRRVLSIEEQASLSSDEVQELVRSGEAVLAQDIAQP